MNASAQRAPSLAVPASLLDYDANDRHVLSADVIEWCKKSLKGKWTFNDAYYVNLSFERHEDAALFKQFWL